MSEDQALLEMHKQHRTGQDKYTYFLLAVTASAVAFSVQKTTGIELSWSQLPLGIAVILWGLSFYFGCKNLTRVQTCISANYHLLQLEKGTHQNQPDHPELLDAAIRGANTAMERNIEHAQFYMVWQNRLLILGAVSFLLWHIFGMILITWKT